MASGQPGAHRDPALAPFTESLDVMGDGSLMLLPTPGHTAGSVSLLVRRAAGRRCCWPGTSPTGQRSSSAASFPASAAGARSRKAAQGSRPGQQQPGLVVLPAHDPTAAQRLLDS